MERIERMLQVHFALLTAVGGLMLSSGKVGFALPAIAVVAAFASFLMVDRLRWFHLPTSMAYVGMGVVAAYCMLSFLVVDPNNQLLAVAQLLVLVLVVLSFQKKSLRVFEQIGVFCLLELIVAAVFNSALIFGVLLIPFSLIGLRSLVLLQTLSAVVASDVRDDGLVRTSAREASLAISNRARRFARYGLAVLTPAVVLVAILFFYGLPRAGGQFDGGRVGGQTTTGFSESLTLDQVGLLLQNPELVMRVSLKDLRANKDYVIRRPLYLRGQVLETYDFDRGSGRWNMARTRRGVRYDFLPQPVYPEERTSNILFDEVEVKIEQQPLSSNVLFAIAPYHMIRDREAIEHVQGRWLIRRRESVFENANERVQYIFGTHGFTNGVQNRFIRYFAPGERRSGRYFGQPTNDPNDPFDGVDPDLIEQMLNFQPRTMPSVKREAERVVSSLSDEAKSSPQRIAQAIEKHLSTDPSFNYTMNLTERRDNSIDPLEEFMASYRRGHCQYFASAMVMMLRSQNIPARIVVGYKSDELNTIGGHYIVRQSHAHAWVEALIAEEDIPVGAVTIGQTQEGPVLVRFDPTPGSLVDDVASGQRVRHFYDFAQSLWNSYVLDMNSDRQSESLFGGEGGSGFANAYSRWLLQIQLWASRINAGELGAGALASGRLFSWRGAVLGILGTLILFGLYQLGLPRWLHWHWSKRRLIARGAEVSSVDFFEQLCGSLKRIPLTRNPGQTPKEFLNIAKSNLGVETQIAAPPLNHLLDLYYKIRFGSRPELTPDEQMDVNRSLDQIDGYIEQA